MHAWLWRRGSIYTFGLFLLASVLFIRGLCPTIYWNDSPEFVTTAYTLGISHPAGSPTYALFANLATYIPLGSIALRVNAFSALAGTLSIILLFAFLWALLGQAETWTRGLSALGGALFLLVSESFWLFTEVAEVYILQNAFLILLCFVLFKARAAPEAVRRRYYWAFAFLYGLSAGVHATMALFVPAFFLFIVLVTPKMFRVQALAFLAFFFLLGFSSYLYLPLRALAEPAFNWGEPRTLQQFWSHITDRKDAPEHTVMLWQQLPHHIVVYLRHLGNEFSLFGCILGCIGSLELFRRDKPLWGMLTLVFLGHTAFFVLTWDVAWGFIPSFVMFALWIGCGIEAGLRLLNTVYRRYPIRVPRIAVSTFFLGSVVVVLSQSYMQHENVTNQQANYAAEHYGRLLLEQLPPDAIVFCEYSWFPLLYLQQVEHYRPDLTFLLQGEVFFPKYYTLISAKRFPNIQHVTSVHTRVISTVDYFWLLSRLNAAKHPLFWDPPPNLQLELQGHIIPDGFLYRFHPDTVFEITPDMLRKHRKLLNLSTNRILQGTLEEATTYFVTHKLNLLGRDFYRLGFVQDAVKTYQAALSIRPGYDVTRINYGSLLMAQGELSQALEHFNIAYDSNPVEPVVNKNLGSVLLRLGDAKQAAHFFERALAFGATGGEVYAQLGEAYAKTGRFSIALATLQTALQEFMQQVKQSPRDDNVQHAISLLREWIHTLEGHLQTGTIFQD